MPKGEDWSKRLTPQVSKKKKKKSPTKKRFKLFHCIHVCITAPLKGIPKAPFRSPTTPSMFSPPSNRTPIAPARTPLRKERGVKVSRTQCIVFLTAFILSSLFFAFIELLQDWSDRGFFLSYCSAVRYFRAGYGWSWKRS